ncbi:MAG TPA: EAL domain-containing protein [Thiobacillaceae bacterium]|nr:EAL domain-containing protein [Thiobacillaceae bacterium]
MGVPGSLSIKQIALAFVIALLVLLSAIAGFAVYQTRAVTQDLSAHSRNAARAELDAAIQRLLVQGKEQATSLASWGETRQQFVMSEYHTYWRDQRVYESGMLSSKLSRVALYDASGARLAPKSAAHGLPARLPDAALRDAGWLANEAGQILLYQAFAVQGGAPQRGVLGYGLIRTDFMASLQKQQGFFFTEPDALSLVLAPGETLSTADILTHLRFSVRPDPDRLRFQEILSHTLLALFVLLLASLIVMSLVYSRLLLRPLHRLSDDIDAMQQGHVGERLRTQPLRIAELENIRRSLHEYQAQLRELHGSLEHQNREFRSQARQDALTGCHNRRAYDEDWTHFQETVKAAPQGVAFLLFDCDRFKAINDTYGHAKGDRVLSIIADAIVMALRANDRLYRLGGDEFAVFMSQATSTQARQIAQRCQSLLEAANFADLGIREPVGVSIGIAYLPAAENARVDELPKQADIAMYTAKQPGRNRIALYGEDTERGAQTLVASRETSAVFQALAAPGMIELHYQPVHALPGRKVVYYEALARIRYHGDLIMPGAFLPVVASRRLEMEFDLSVLQQADADLAAMLIPHGCGMSINLSAQSISRPEVISQLLEFSRHSAHHPLMLEITETSLITQMEEVRTYLDLLRSLNFRIAMDDFGTGYSPLRYLVDLPVDVVKFDTSLVGKLSQKNRTGRIVTDFVDMMHDAGYLLVAEGVEDEGVLRRVESLGFSHVQGYLLGRPARLSPPEFHGGEARAGIARAG